MKKRLIILLILLLPIRLFASDQIYPFTNTTQENRFKQITNELRCLVCQNETIAESGATLAADLRENIYQNILKGKTDQQIIEFLVSRYGNFIRYKPPLLISTLLLWFGPLIFLILSLILFSKNIRSRNDR